MKIFRITFHHFYYITSSFLTRILGEKTRKFESEILLVLKNSQVVDKRLINKNYKDLTNLASVNVCLTEFSVSFEGLIGCYFIFKEIYSDSYI